MSQEPRILQYNDRALDVSHQAIMRILDEAKIDSTVEAALIVGFNAAIAFSLENKLPFEKTLGLLTSELNEMLSQMTQQMTAEE